jgi:hypothetical protein
MSNGSACRRADTPPQPLAGPEATAAGQPDRHGGRRRQHGIPPKAHGRVLAAGGAQEQLIDALLTLARGHAGLDRAEPFDLASLARDVLDSRRAEATASASTSAALPCRPWTCYTLLRSQGYEVGRLVRYRCLVGQHIRLGGAAQRVGSLAFCVVIATAATVVMNRASTRPLTARKAALGSSARRRAAISVPGRLVHRAMALAAAMVSHGPAMNRRR